MTTNKLAIIGGSGLYDIEEFKDKELLDLNTPWGKPSDQILKQSTIIKKFIFTRHGRVILFHHQYNFRATLMHLTLGVLI